VTAVAVAILVTFGFTASLEEILRYGLIQTHTPDAHLGRVNSLWSAQETAGYAAGSLGAGLTGRALGPGSAIMAYGIASALLATALTAVLPGLRRAAFPLSATGATRFRKTSQDGRPDPRASRLAQRDGHLSPGALAADDCRARLNWVCADRPPF
jgi:hypothetical protein